MVRDGIGIGIDNSMELNWNRIEPIFPKVELELELNWTNITLGRNWIGTELKSPDRNWNWIGIDFSRNCTSLFYRISFIIVFISLMRFFQWLHFFKCGLMSRHSDVFQIWSECLEIKPHLKKSWCNHWKNLIKEIKTNEWNSRKSDTAKAWILMQLITSSYMYDLS